MLRLVQSLWARTIRKALHEGIAIHGLYCTVLYLYGSINDHPMSDVILFVAAVVRDEDRTP